MFYGNYVKAGLIQYICGIGRRHLRNLNSVYLIQGPTIALVYGHLLREIFFVHHLEESVPPPPLKTPIFSKVFISFLSIFKNLLYLSYLDFAKFRTLCLLKIYLRFKGNECFQQIQNDDFYICATKCRRSLIFQTMNSVMTKKTKFELSKVYTIRF